MRLLLIEDDAMIGEGLLRVLRRERYAVDWAQDGKVAETATLSTPYDLLLLDLGLPELDGLQLLRRLRRRDTELPVIIVTARDGLADRIRGLDSGADDYLVKPFAGEELVARIRAISRRRAGRGEPELRAGPLRMDPALHRVWLNDEPIEVSAKDFSLLRLLMDRTGVVVSREQIEDRLYAWNEEIASNAVEVRIHNLRKKLGSDVIQTVRGVGYRVRTQP